MVEGEATAAGVPPGKGDGLGLLRAGDVAVEAAAGAELLIFELPASEIS